MSCTGVGELFVRHAVAHDVAARMLYTKAGVADAARLALAELPPTPGGAGGLIALDRDGRPAFAVAPGGAGMYRGYVTEAGDVYVATADGEPRKVTAQGK